MHRVQKEWKREGGGMRPWTQATTTTAHACPVWWVGVPSRRRRLSIEIGVGYEKSKWYA